MLSNTQKKATLLLLAKQFSVAALYLLSGSLTHHFIISNGIVSIVWLGSGLALAALLLGGRTYIWGVFFGSFALNVLTNDSIWAIGGITLADVLAALLGYKLLTRNGQSDFNLRTLSNYLQLILLGGCMASVVGALIGVLSMLLAGYITPSNFFVNFVHWWMGDVMGVVLLATLALVWKHRPLLSMKQCLEAILLLSATFIVGQIVFIGWFHDSVGLIARGYWQYFFVTLIAIRLGGCAVTIALMMIATQALIGAVNTTGLFSDDIAKTGLQNYWFYMLSLSIVGMAFVTYVSEIKTALESLRIKDKALNAAANGIVITDVEGRIEWVNPAFSQLTGYSVKEVLGRNSRELLKSGKHDKAFYQNLWDTIKSNQVWHGELINLRKDGVLYEEEMTITPMSNEAGEISHFIAIKQDITKRKHAENEIVASEKRLFEILNVSPIAVRIATNHGHKVVFCNPQYPKLIKNANAIGEDPENYYANAQDYEDVLNEVELGNTIIDREIKLNIPNGSTVWMLASYMPIQYQGEAAVLGWFYDITKSKETELTLQESEQKLRGLYELSPLGIALTDMNGRYVEYNESFRRICGYSDDELNALDYWTLTPKKYEADEARQLESLKNTGHYGPYEKEYLRKDGTLIPICLNGILVTGSDRQNYIWSIVEDITERKLAEAHIHSLAFYDPLTHLPNRRLLNDRLGQTILSSKRSRLYGALMFLDLDNFKPLNDTHGHGVGDLLLIEAARRISSCIRETDTATRFGGDEFVVMLSELHEDQDESTAQAKIVAEKIRTTLSEPYSLIINQDGKEECTVEHLCTSSIGVVVFNSNDSQEYILKKADRAMYQAKELGRNRVVVSTMTGSDTV